jgi:hypothetical protein
MKEFLQRLWLLSRKTIIGGVVGFFFWTIALTPVMFFYVKISSQQYLKWIVGSQLIFSPVLSALSMHVINWAVKTLTSKSKKEMKWPE